MVQIKDVVFRIKKNVAHLISHNEQLKCDNEELLLQLRNCEDKILRQQQQLEQLQDKNESLKIVNTILGSDENKRDTKLKINYLIKEIDKCINQLSK